MKKRVTGSDSTVIHKDVIYEKWKDDNGAEFFFPVETIAQQEPIVRWTGGKISWQSWVNICAFCEMVSEKESSECQVQLFYSDTDKTFFPWAFPQQKKSGMVTKELNDHPNFIKQLHEIRSRGYYPFGTLHTHDKAGAFQSSTDHNDEKESEGLHITLGKISRKDPYDVHSRFTAKRPGYEDPETKELVPAEYCMLPVEWTDFIEPPDSIIADRLPSFLRKKILETVLLRPDISTADEDMIDLWMKNRIEEEKKALVQTKFDHRFEPHQHPWRQKRDWTNPPRDWLNGSLQGQERRSAFPDWEPGTNHGIDYTYHGAINDPDVNEDYFKSMKEYDDGSSIVVERSAVMGALDKEVIKDELEEFCEHNELDAELLFTLLTEGPSEPENHDLLIYLQGELEELIEELEARLDLKIGYAGITDILEEIQSSKQDTKGTDTKKKKKNAITKRKKLKHVVQSV